MFRQSATSRTTNAQVAGAVSLYNITKVTWRSMPSESLGSS
jgi:hypothetical protein